MKVNIDIFAGVCGFRTSGKVRSEDEQNVTFSLSSDCEKISVLLAKLGKAEPFDAFAEISAQSGGNARLLEMCRKELCGCCSGCVVPSGLYKAMQTAAGLALPRDMTITLSKEI